MIQSAPEGGAMNQKPPREYFHGETLFIRKLPGTVLAETSYLPYTRISKHSHDHAYFCFVRRGIFLKLLEREPIGVDLQCLFFTLVMKNTPTAFNSSGDVALTFRLIIACWVTPAN